MRCRIAKRLVQGFFYPFFISVPINIFRTMAPEADVGVLHANDEGLRGWSGAKLVLAGGRSDNG